MKNASHDASVVTLFPKGASCTDQDSQGKLLLPRQKRPLVIRFDSRHLEAIRHVCDDAFDLIMQELRLWRESTGQRELHILELHYNSAQIQPYEITKFVHFLARAFLVAHATYRLVIEPSDAEAEMLALFKGLGFEHCQFALDKVSPCDFATLKFSSDSARRFNFSKVGFQLLHAGSLQNLSESIRVLESDFHFDYIFIGDSTLKLQSKDLNEAQTLFEEDLSNMKVDYLDLGPETTSKICGYSLSTLCDPARYVDALKSAKLPLNEQIETPCGPD